MMADEGNMIGNDELTSGAGASHDEDRGNQHKIHRPKGYGIDNEEGLYPRARTDVEPNNDCMRDSKALWGTRYMICELNITRD